LDRRVTTVAWY
jgi:hypothetical protein